MTIHPRRETTIPQDEECIEDDDVSNTTTDGSTSNKGHNLVSTHIPRFFRFDRAPVEATGLSVDMYTRATIIMSSLFLGPALLELAKEDVQDRHKRHPT